MKKYIFLAMLMSFQTLFSAFPISGMEDCGGGHYVQSQEARKLRLKGALEGIFGAEVTISDDDKVLFRGSEDQLKVVTDKLNNFDRLREDVIPVSKKAVTTQVCHSPNFTCWRDFLVAVGLPPETSDGLKVLEDRDNCLTLAYEKETINQHLADAYVDLLKKQSETFKWLSLHHRGLVQYNPPKLTIQYGLLASYFCQVELPREATEDEEIFTSTISLNHVLNRFTAAAGGDISLVASDRGTGQYHVRTVLPGTKGEHAHDGPPPTVEFVIDRSGSMGGEPIRTVNETIPTLLSQFRKALRSGESLVVKIYTFNEELQDHATYTLDYGSYSNLTWKTIVSGGGTDLTHVGKRMCLSTPDERRVVVGFTDGNHACQVDIKKSYEAFRALQHNGRFAKPFLCRVGDNSQGSEGYFSTMSEIFGGSFSAQDNIQEFCQKVSSSIPMLLESTEPLILTIGGDDITIRLRDANPDIHTTQETLKEGDSALFRGVRRTVDLSLPSSEPVKAETREEKKLRLRAEKAKILAELKELEGNSDSEEDVT